jgi:DNA polymerase III epsilon subunit-like protein
MKVLVFDTETTGLPVERNPSIYDTQKWPHIIQLSYIVYDSETNEIITVEDDTNINITPESQKIHNISREMLDSKGIPIQDALHKFIRFTDMSDLLVGHNVSFDKRMVIVEGVRNKIKMNINETYCTMKNSIDVCKIERVGQNGDKYFKYPTLSELHNELFKQVPKNTHNALIDILLCMRCFIQLELKQDISRINRTIRLMLRDAH